MSGRWLFCSCMISFVDWVYLKIKIFLPWLNWICKACYRIEKGQVKSKEVKNKLIKIDSHIEFTVHVYLGQLQGFKGFDSFNKKGTLILGFKCKYSHSIIMWFYYLLKNQQLK